jgi:hypothetical protein
MNSSPSNKSSKTAIIILILLLVGSLFFIFKMHQDSVATELQLENEKTEVMNNLDEITFLYSEAIADNKVVNTKLEDALDRLKALKIELKKSETTVSSLMRYKKKYFELESEMEVLLNENTVLKLENLQLTTTLDSTQVQLNSQLVTNVVLNEANLNLSKSVDVAKKLSIDRLEGFGVIQKRSGRLVPTTRARRVDNLRICYVVPSNLLTEPGEKRYYVQVIDPNLNVIGSNTAVQFKESVLNYSYVTRFTYDNLSLDVCNFVTSQEIDFEKGVYTVNVFEQSVLVSTSTFSLK